MTTTNTDSVVKHTPGPWCWRDQYGRCELVAAHSGTLSVMDFVRRGMNAAQPRFGIREGCHGGIMRKADEIDVTEHPDATLMADAPAMSLMLRIIQLGLARFETETGEFCFDGLRYSVSPGNWSRVVDVIGWNKCRAAIAKSEGKAV